MGIHYGAFPPGLPKGDPEDCGAFCLWWYTQPKQKYSKTGEFDTLWAYALRGHGNTWRTSDPKSGFSSREKAFEAGTLATSNTEPCDHEWSLDEQGTRRCIGCGVPR